MRPFARLAVLFAILFAPASAAAGNFGSGYFDFENWLSAGNAVQVPRTEDWAAAIALGAGSGPEYLGSDTLETKPLPLFEVLYRDTFFLSTQQGLGYNLWRKRTVRAGPRITLDPGRESADSPVLLGLPDIDPSVELGAFLEVYGGAFRFKGHVKYDVSNGYDGFIGAIDGAYGFRWSENASMFIGANITAMSEGYAASFFGVPPANATGNRAAFNAGAGIRDVGAYVQFVYDFNQSFFFGLDARGQQLIGDAADSPITRDDVQVFAGGLIGFRF